LLFGWFCMGFVAAINAEIADRATLANRSATVTLD